MRKEKRQSKAETEQPIYDAMFMRITGRSPGSHCKENVRQKLRSGEFYQP